MYLESEPFIDRFSFSAGTSEEFNGDIAPEENLKMNYRRAFEDAFKKNCKLNGYRAGFNISNL